MDRDATIKAEMRLFVLEALVALLYATHHQRTPDPSVSLETLRDQLTSLARKQTFGVLGAAHSDLASAELEAAVDAALAHQRGWLGLPLP